jgi:hypothetical protein
MINLPNTLSKGEVLSFALNKSLVIAAVSDSYWSDSANISKCIVVYKSTSGHQRKRLEFDFSQESPTVVAEWSVKARNGFEIEEIVLIDFDSGSYTIPRASLPSGKGISFAGEGGGGGGSVVTQVVHNYVPNGAINDMVTDGTNVYIGGAFTSLRFMAPNAATISATTAENQLKDQVSGKFPSFNGQINCFAYDGPDVLYVGGTFSAMDSQTRYGFAKLIKSGNNWVSDQDWNVATNNGPAASGNQVITILVLSDRIIFGGSFSSWKGPTGTNVTANGLVSISKTTKEVLHFGGIGSGTFVYDIKQDGEYIWLAGNFAPQKVHSTSWAFQTLSNRPNFNTGIFMYNVAVVEDGVFYCGAITSPAFQIVKLNKTDGGLVPGFTSPWTGRSTGEQALSLLFKDGALYVGGTWNRAETGKNIVKLDPATGAVISAFAPGNACFRGSLVGAVWKILDSGSSVIALGQFDGKETSGSAATNGNVVKLNATTGAADTSFDTLSALQGSTDLLRCAVPMGSNLLIGGNFTGWGGYARQGVAKLTKDADGNWKVVDAFNTSSGGTGVNTLALSGNDLYIGGTFTTWAGSARNRVAKLNATTGALDPSFGVGVFTSGLTTGQFNGVLNTVNKVLVDGSDLVIGGAFTTYSKKSSATSTTSPATPYWIRVATTTNTETVPMAAVNGAINDVVIDGSDAIFAGNFSSWAGVSRRTVVKANKVTGNLTSGWTSPTYSYDGAGFIVKIVGQSLFVGSFTTGVGGVSNASGIYVLNKDTGAVLKTYNLNTTFGYYSQAAETGNILEYGDYVYILTGRTSGGATFVSGNVRRIQKFTLAYDSTWGFSFNDNTSTKKGRVLAAAIVGDDVIVSAGSLDNDLRLTPTNKRLYSLSVLNASQKNNI